jgi:anti-anti-sigma regulatory factor
MDHRQSSRIPLTLEVDIAFRALPLGRFLTRNTSRDGMFLETGAANLKPGDVVDLQVHLSHAPQSISAVVVHRSRAGVGVMLTSEAPGYDRFVLAALRCGRPVLQPVWAGAAASVIPDKQGRPLAVDTAVAGELRWGKDSKALVLRVGERLDLSLSELVQQAIQSIATTVPERVVVDLGATRRVFDSGVALLLLLRNRAGHLKGRMYLANCAPKIFSRLARAGIASQFRMA